MPVHDAAHRVGDRVFHVAAVDQHRVERGDVAAAARAGTGTFHHARQLGKGGGRVALGGGRLAPGEADFALRHGKAGDAVEQQQDLLALIAEMLGYGGGGPGGLAAHQRRLVAGGDDDHRARHAFLAEIFLQKVLHLAAALADKADDDHIGLGAARQHRHHGRLADAGAGKDPHALAPAERGEDVHHLDLGVEPLAHPAALESGRGRGANPAGGIALGQAPLAVERLAEGVHHPSDPGVIGADLVGAVADLYRIAGAHPVPAAERQEPGAPLVDAHNFRQHRSLAALDETMRADPNRALEARHRQDQAERGFHLAGNA